MSSLCLLPSLQLRSFFGQNRPVNWANCEANTAVDAGIKVDPVPRCPFKIKSRRRLDAGDRTGRSTVRYSFTDISCDRIRHKVLINQNIQIIQLANITNGTESARLGSSDPTENRQSAESNQSNATCPSQPA